MGKKPKLEELNYLFDKGEDFELTDTQYEIKTGVALPKEVWYLENRSALAKRAKEKNYTLEIINKKTVVLRKIIKENIDCE